jgi:hypothetical protein
MQIQYASESGGAYRAGACNIGPQEIARRRQSGLLAIAFTVAVAAVLILIDATPILRAAIFPSLAGGLIALEQGRRRFCVAYAAAGVRNFGPLGAPQSVADARDRTSDRRAALILVAYTSAIALAITLAFVVLPV